VSDIDTVLVDSLKALDPKRPIREADIYHQSQLKEHPLNSNKPQHLPLPNALGQYRIAMLHIGFRGKGSLRLRPVAARW
jgi:hypothetical protein